MQSADAKSFIQDLSFRKGSRKGNLLVINISADFLSSKSTFQLCTSRKAEKIFGYTSAKYEALQRFQECNYKSKLVSKLKLFNMSDKTTKQCKRDHL